MNGTYDSQPVAHVMDFAVQQITGTLGSRAQLGSEVCFVLGGAWEGTLNVSQSNLVSYSGCTWVDLDTDVGPTGVFNGPPFPIAGQNTAQPQPGNVAVRLTKNAASPRGGRRGSIYMPGGTEALTPATSANTMSGTAFSDLQTRVATFYADLTTTFASAGGATARLLPVIVRTRGGEYLTTSAWTGLAVQTRLASQRRRLDLT